MPTPASPLFAVATRGVLFATLVGAALLAQASSATEDFSRDWRFHLGDAPGAEAKEFADGTWEPAALPHTARIEALVTNTTDKQQWEGVCWYRKTFTLPPEAAGQVVLVRFEGAMNRATLFANGEKITENVDGYTPFVADLSAFAGMLGPLTIAVRLDNTHSPVTGPKPLPILDFHLYHGLYRTASLIIKPPLHITDEILENKPASGGVFVTYPRVSSHSAEVKVQVHLRNRAPQPGEGSLVARLLDASGHEVARRETAGLLLAAGADRAFDLRLDVDSPRLWSPQTPHLYTLEVALVSDGKRTDTHRERIGIRTFAVVPGGVSINGEPPRFLRGVNRHQEYPYIGNALSDAAQYRDALKIKQAGFDYVRISHYPHAPAFMDACDELGLVTMNAILGWQFNPATEAFYANRVQASRELVRRDRNRPGVFFWEVSLNETRMSSNFIRRLHRAAHEEHPGSPFYTAGWVKGFDVKVAARQAGSTKEFAAATFPSIVSEYGDWEYYAGNAGLNQDAWGELKKAERNSRQLRGDGEIRLLQQATNFQEAHNENLGTRAAGDGLWVMYDYNRGYADDLESSGPSDIFRLPKFSYYFFQSQRDASEKLAVGGGGPMVFIATYWTEKSPLAVRIFSNGDEVQLSLNGRDLGRRQPDQTAISANLRHAPFTFPLPKFEPGELRATAYLAGESVATHVVKTPGAPAALALGVDLSGRPAKAGGDVLFLYARITDADGGVVPDATTPVTFVIESGDALLIGDNPIPAEAGIASILLKTGSRPGVVNVKASAGDFAAQTILEVD